MDGDIVHQSSLSSALNQESKNSLTKKPVLHFEVCQNPTSSAKAEVVQTHVRRLLGQQTWSGDFTLTSFDDDFLSENVKFISLTDSNDVNTHNQSLSLETCDTCIHVFHLNEEGHGQEVLEGEEDLPAANHWLLPSADFHGLWDNLIFETPIKTELLQYAATTLIFSDRQVNSNIIAWNRVVLLHGPPGTGKTSLCKALAHKLSVRLSHRYHYGQLLEINSHSLFSKWFSESGKLVLKMFDKIQELVDDEHALVCILIDEVESLTAARKAAMSGTEPSDAIRVVNAVLTQLDQIKKNPNVLILTTSNVTGAIDLAFVDRADIKQFIGLPGPSAIYHIYLSCINELIRTGIVYSSEPVLDLRTLGTLMKNRAAEMSLKLHSIATKSEGLSGRTLRKLPFIAHALYIQSPQVSLDVFLDALESAISKQFQDREDLTNS